MSLYLISHGRVWFLADRQLLIVKTTNGKQLNAFWFLLLYRERERKLVYSHKHSTKCTGYKHRTYNGQKVDSEWVINKIIIDNGEVEVDEVGKRGGWRWGWAGDSVEMGKGEASNVLGWH